MSVLKICFFVIVATLAVLQSAEAQTAKVGLPLTKIGEGFYYFGKTGRNWFSADHYCRSYGLALVTFETRAEMDLVGVEIIKQGLTANGNGVWTSGTDFATEGKWIWSQTGKLATFFAWTGGEPNNWDNNENCLNMWDEGGKMTWNDANCRDDIFPFVCELPTACWGY